MIFYMIGFVISDLIDFSFEDHDPSKEDKYLMIEILIEFMIAYWIRSIFEKYHTRMLDPFFKNIGMKTPDYLYTLIPIAFILGVYQNLKKGNKKIQYLWEKYSNQMLNYIKK